MVFKLACGTRVTVGAEEILADGDQHSEMQDEVHDDCEESEPHELVVERVEHGHEDIIKHVQEEVERMHNQMDKQVKRVDAEMSCLTSALIKHIEMLSAQASPTIIDSLQALPESSVLIVEKSSQTFPQISPNLSKPSRNPFKTLPKPF